jgi:hypothetical protein
MYKQDSLHQLLESYKITLTKRTMQRKYRIDPYNFSITGPDIEYNAYIRDEMVPMVVVELEEAQLLQMADKVVEFDDLMRDPETAKLLMEARFINRLKGRF